MAITQAVCNSFKSEVLQEGHQIKTDTLKIALFYLNHQMDILQKIL